MALIQCNFFSSSLMRTVTINVILPTDKKVFPGQPKPEEKSFKTLYLMHGILGNYTDWVSSTRLQTWAQDKNIAIIMPSGDNSFYVDKPVPGERYGTFIRKELVEFTRKSFPLSHKREDTFIGGLSMGGYGAIINGLMAPETFSVVCALSAATIAGRVEHLIENSDNIFYSKEFFERVFGDSQKFIGSDHDYVTVAKKLAESNNQKPKIFMACGYDDNLFESNQLFKDQLQSLNFEVTWIEDQGKHDWDFWNKYIEKFINWLPLDEAVPGVSSGNVR